VDQTQITQVIDNLMINATEAMEAPGRITLNVRNEHLTEHDAPGLSPGPYIVIRVKDEGLGIPLEHRKLLFDPFFSTKPAGSGLGLPTSLRIAERHGGTLLLEASGPAGSTFVLYLPAVPLAQAAVAEAQPQAGAGLGRALIIDDEPNVRKVLTRMLASLGWTAEEAGSGERGLEILAHAPVAEIAYDLVITDLTMPGGMGGVEVAKAIRERGEGVPVVLSSGYSPESTLPEDSLALFAARLGKPYTLEELRRVLVSVVGAGGCV
jgi:CheY-like chemotaxis protein